MPCLTIEKQAIATQWAILIQASKVRIHISTSHNFPPHGIYLMADLDKHCSLEALPHKRSLLTKIIYGNFRLVHLSAYMWGNLLADWFISPAALQAPCLCQENRP